VAEHLYRNLRRNPNRDNRTLDKDYDYDQELPCIFIAILIVILIEPIKRKSQI